MGIEAGAIERMRRVIGLEPLPSQTGVEVLRQVLNQGAAHVVVLHGEPKRLWAYLRSAGEVPQLAKEGSVRLLPVRVTEGGAETSMVAEVERVLNGLVATELKLPQEALDRDMPLSEFGFDSITLTSFGKRVEPALRLRVKSDGVF